MPEAIPKTVVGLGEVLWDLLPRGKQLGGAPANFAYHSARLGAEGIVASRVGEDALGAQILERLETLELSSDFVQLDPSRPTGTVAVGLGPRGEPTYTIVEGVAWDRLEWNEPWARLAARTDAVCFGSLAQRSAQSRSTIVKFLEQCRPGAVRVFDINLRADFYSAQTLGRGLELARIAKLNEQELLKLAEILGFGGDDEATRAMALRERFRLELVCVTRGERGSLLVGGGQISSHPGFGVEVADTVGAGDAFIAAVVHHHLAGAPLDEINRAANRLGAYVASRSGATPPIPPEILADVI